MTAASFAHRPLQVGSVALAHTGRAALWVIQRYMRNPLTNSAIAALVVTTAMAGSNALYGQHREHPHPLFGASSAMTTGSVEAEPVIPKTRPKSFAFGTPVKQKVAAINPADALQSPIGNEQVFELQRKLERMQLFTGTIDGYYGKQTARAIRKFEELQGLKPTGQLTPDIIAAILAAPIAAPDSKPAPKVVAPTPAPTVIVAPKAEEAKPAAEIVLPKVQSAPVEDTLPAASKLKPQSLAALAKPAPLTAELTTGSIGNATKPVGKTVLGRPVPDTPEAALELAADTAGDAINTIIDGVQSVAMSPPPKPMTTQQFAATAKAVTTAIAAAPAALAAATDAEQVAALPENPQVGVPLKIEEEAPKPGETIAVLDTDATPDQVQPVSVSDPVTVAKVQRGLASLGFLHGPADGVAGEATAKAIRNFEVYFNYKVTGRISPELLDLLLDNGAVI